MSAVKRKVSERRNWRKFVPMPPFKANKYPQRNPQEIQQNKRVFESKVWHHCSGVLAFWIWMSLSAPWMNSFAWLYSFKRSGWSNCNFVNLAKSHCCNKRVMFWRISSVSKATLGSCSRTSSVVHSGAYMFCHRGVICTRYQCAGHGVEHCNSYILDAVLNCLVAYATLLKINRRWLCLRWIYLFPFRTEK